MSDQKGKGLGSPEKMRGQDNPEKPKNKPSAKPRASRAGTRSVSTLNAEQLARKRANDREAQRAIRQRTREHVERLEKRIKELSGEDDGNPDSDLAFQEVQRKNSELEEELRILRETLYGSEDATSSPELTYSNSVYGVPSAGEPTSVSYPVPWASQNTNLGPSVFAPTSTPISRPDAWASQVTSYNGLRTSSPHPGFGQAGPTSSFESEYGSDFGPNDGAPAAGHMIPSAPEHMQVFNPNPSHQIGRSIPFRGGRPENLWPVPGGTSTPNVSISGIGPSKMIARPIPPTQNIPYSFTNQPSPSVWEPPIRISQTASLGESLILEAVQRLRGLRDQGVTGTALTGPRQPSLGPFLQPGYSRSAHPITLTLSEMIRVNPLPGFAEKIGTLIMMYPVFQWLVAPSHETRAWLPEYYAPTASQLNTPHPIWVSFVRWPRLRDAIIADQEHFVAEEFEYLYASSININWPYEQQGIVEQVGDVWGVTQAFKRHAMELGNWSLNLPFQRRYPELRDVCKFTEYPLENQEALEVDKKYVDSL